MTTEWIKFTDLLSTIIDNRGKTCPVQSFGIPLIATNCINGIDLYPNYDTKRFVSDETYKTWFRGHPKAGDILFVCKGSPGRTNWVPDPVDFCIAQDMVAVRADPKKIYPKYLFAVLRSSLIQSQIQNMHVGTMIPHFKKGDFDKLRIPVLSVEKQNQVGDLYFDISERISVLKKNNETLEQIASAIFKSWFVDFDPVTLKSQGKLAENFNAELASFFPNTFVESPKGLIPEGWSLCAIYDLATYINGAAYKAFEPNAEKRGLPIIKIAELKSGVTDTTAYSDVEMPKKYLIETEDILFSWSGNPDTSIDTFVWSHEPAWLNQHIFRVIPNRSNERAFVLQLLKNMRSVFSEIARNKQTTGLGHVTVGDLKQLLIVKPSQNVIESFNQNVGCVHQRIFQNNLQINTLLCIRDSLVPHLVDNELRINDNELISSDA